MVNVYCIFSHACLKFVCTGPVSLVVKHVAYQCGWPVVRFPGLSNPTQCSQWLVIAAMFLPSCVAQALSCGDGSRQHFYVMYPAPAKPCFFLTKRGFIEAIICEITATFS